MVEVRGFWRSFALAFALVCIEGHEPSSKGYSVFRILSIGVGYMLMLWDISVADLSWLSIARSNLMFTICCWCERRGQDEMEYQ